MLNNLKLLSNWCYRYLASGPVLVIALLIFAIFIVVILPNMAGRLTELTGTDISPDTSFIYSAKDLYSMADAYGAAGREYYIYSRFTFDLIWPAAYLFFLATAISFLLRITSPYNHLRLLNLPPFAGVVLDLLENSGASLLMYRYPLPTPVIAELTPIFTILKWTFISISFTALLAGIMFTAVYYLRKNRHK